MYEADTTYFSEQGFEIHLLWKAGNYWAFCFGQRNPQFSHWATIPSSSISYCTESYLTHNGYHRGAIERFNCRCGYKSTTPFGTQCPGCGESMAFYGVKENWENLPPMEDLLA